MDRLGTHNDRTWNEYNEINPTISSLSSIWVRQLVDLLIAETNSAMRVLDYGCGFFDVGIRLAAKVCRVDGYDPFDDAREFAMRITSVLPNVTIYSVKEDIPKGAYGLILLNSVMQYFGTLENVKQYLLFFKGLLKQEPDSRLLVTDIIPANHTFSKDATALLFYGAANGRFFDTLKYLRQANKKPKHLNHLAIDKQQMVDIATSVGLKCNICAENPTPMKRRYACMFSLIHS